MHLNNHRLINGCTSIDFHRVLPDDHSRSFPFYPVETGIFATTDKYSLKRENMDNYLLIVTTGGCGKMIYKNEECFLTKGSAVLIDCRPYQEYFTPQGETWDFCYLHFEALSMNGYRSLFDTLKPVILRSEDYACKLMDVIYSRTPFTDPLSRAKVSNAISNILTEMLASLSDESSPRNSETVSNLTWLADYIRTHCTESLHLDDFSKFSNLSKHHLVRIFGQQFGMPPYRYLHFCRINLAQHLLRNTNMTITEIAIAVGYNDPVVFARHFRSFHDVPPGVYRQNTDPNG